MQNKKQTQTSSVFINILNDPFCEKSLHILICGLPKLIFLIFDLNKKSEESLELPVKNERNSVKSLVISAKEK